MTIGPGEPPFGGSRAGDASFEAVAGSGHFGTPAPAFAREGQSSGATVVPGSPTTTRPPVSVTAAAARRRGRRARLTLKRIDPWSTLKFSLVYGLVGMAVLLVVAVVLYGVVDALGVISSLRKFLSDVSDSSSGPGLGAWLSFDRVVLVALVVGLVNVVLFTAFATLTAFIYNVCTDIVGGVEVTLSERE
ncbi:MAG TPA: DUF3566 domain-containing protein [Mycobacteriales bacterium]|nr:DUF3566 domain-containing protein [Mycobacteriales bacterium]